MKRQPDRIPRDRSDTMTAMGRNQEVITRFQVDSLPLKFKARGATGQQNPLVTGLVIPESLGTWLAVGMDRLKSEGLPDEQRASFLLSLETGSLSEEVADNGFHGMD
jgi:hypothetical protein